MTDPVRIAMWSGPRNLSTAMMRSFGARADTAVVDEPFYAAYLNMSGLEHPMRDEILAHDPTDPDRVIENLLGPVPREKTIYYQKHMTHHMLPEIDRSWFDRVRHAFLIRSPEDVIASYQAKRARVSLPDIGFMQQVEIFEAVSGQSGTKPVVIDSRDILSAPETVLRKMCGALGIEFDPSMLSWPPGRRETDGIWASHWYGAVEKSTGFSAPERSGQKRDLSDENQALASQARPYYEALAQHRILP